MADEEQLRILRQGPAAWNEWRRQASGISVNLIGANLNGANLNGANLSGVLLRMVNLSKARLSMADLTGATLDKVDLSEANLSEANLSRANLSRADLSRADLTRASLSVANLSVGVNLLGADLGGAYLSRADFGGADLGGANLSRADLGGARLSGAVFSGITLSKANLSKARLYETVFADVDLSGCEGLESCVHAGPSTIDIRTLQRSGRLPLAFLRGVGLSDALIDGLPSLLGQPNQFHSCFISYSSKNDEFVHRLYADLQNKGVRCWIAPHDMPIGAKIRDTIDDAIRLRDKVLIVLSEAAIASDWVEDEVDKAFEEERQRGGVVLIPVRLDDTVLTTNEAWAAKLRRSRNIGDFRTWQDLDAYLRTLERLLRDLRVETPGAATG